MKSLIKIDADVRSKSAKLIKMYSDKSSKSGDIELIEENFIKYFCKNFWNRVMSKIYAFSLKREGEVLIFTSESPSIIQKFPFAFNINSFEQLCGDKTKNNKVSPKNSGRILSQIKDYLMSNDSRNYTETIDIYEDNRRTLEILSCKVSVTIDKRGNFVDIFFYYQLTFTIPKIWMNFIPNIDDSITDTLLCDIIFKDLFSNKTISPIYDISAPIEYKPFTTAAIVKLHDGVFFFFYKEDKYKDNRKEYLDKITKGEHLPNTLIAIDTNAGLLFQTNSRSEINTFSIHGYMGLTSEDLNRFFNQTVLQTIYGAEGLNKISKISHNNFNTELEIKVLDAFKRIEELEKKESKTAVDEAELKRLHLQYDEYKTENSIIKNLKLTLKQLYELDNDNFFEIFRELKQRYVSKRKSLLPSTYFSVVAVCIVCLSHIEEHKEIEKIVHDQRNAFNRATTGDKVPLPNMNPNAFLFPHQAVGLSKLDKAGHTAILDVGTGGGKCIIGDSLVPTSKGLYTIEELWESSKKEVDKHGFRSTSFNVYTTQGIKECDKTYKTKGETIRIEFTDGSILEGLPEHKIICLTDDYELRFVRLSDLKVNDNIPKTIGTNLFNDKRENFDFIPDFKWDYRNNITPIIPSKMSVNLSMILGYIVCEKYFPDTIDRIKFTHPEIMEHFCKLCYDTFNVEDCFYSYSVKELIKYLCGSELSEEKVVPFHIRTAPKKCQAAFLSTLFEGDGSIYIGDEWVLDYTTISIQLALQVKVMLENMGIVSKIIHKVNQPYTIIIAFQSIKQFQEEIGFISTVKKDKLQQYVDWVLNDSKQSNYFISGEYNSIPIGSLVNDTIEKIISNYTETSNSTECEEYYTFAKLTREVNIENMKGNSVVTRHSYNNFIKILNNLPDNVEEILEKDEIYLKNIKNIKRLYNKQWTSIKSITYTNKEKPVFDLYVPGPHSYSVNGLMSHNTVLMIMDILNLMNKGEVKRPLVVAPGQLIGQWIGEINFFTGGTINAVAVTVETCGEWDTKEIKGIENIVKNAPKNTIFLTNYSLLTTQTEKSQAGGIIFKRLEWLRNIVKPDYIALDESHTIKNVSSLRSKACLEFRDVSYRRLATGTLIPNNPIDLLNQVSFLNPRILGSKEQFAEKYSSGGLNAQGQIQTFKKGFKEKLRKDLLDNTFYMSYSEKDWAATLPKIEYSYNKVEMSSELTRIYKFLVAEIISEIMADPKLKELWDRYQNEPDLLKDSATGNFILGKFAKLEQFLTSPDQSTFAKYSLGNSNLISPKMEKIDELIGESIASGHKCIVACHFKKPAQHLIAHSKYSNVSIYVDALRKNKITEFQDKNNKKAMVMFAVVQNISEGLNLQVADRIILADIDWTPGKLTQLKARIFRPNPKFEKDENGNTIVKNLNEDKTVHIDYVLCDNSADVLKFCFQTYKKIDIAEVIEESPIKLPEDIEKPELSEANLMGNWERMSADIYENLSVKYNEHIKDIIEHQKATGNHDLVSVVHSEKSLGTEKIPTPWVIGMPLPIKEENSKKEESLLKYLTDRGAFKSLNRKDSRGYTVDSDDNIEEDIDSEENGSREGLSQEAKEDIYAVNKIDISNFESLLLGREVRTEFGKGKITKVNPKTVTVSDGIFTKTISINKIIILKTKDEIPPEEEELPSNAIIMHFTAYDGMPAFVVDPGDAQHHELRSIQFIWQGPYWYKKFKAKNNCLLVLEKLRKKFKIDNAVINDIDIMANRINKNIPVKYHWREDVKSGKEEKTFILRSHKRSPEGTLKIFPLMRENEFMLVASRKMNDAELSEFGFRIEKGMWYHFVKNKTQAKIILKKVEKDLGLIIANREELIEDTKYFNMGIE